MNGSKTIQADQMAENKIFGQFGLQNGPREPVKTPVVHTKFLNLISKVRENLFQH